MSAGPAGGRSSAAALVVLTCVAGLATGIVTQVGQSALPSDWSQAANAISPWLLVAFLVGSRMPGARTAVLAGVATLVLALVGYYLMTQVRYGIGGSTSALVFWGLGAVVGGPMFGLAGNAWRRGELRTRSVALGLMAAAFVAEGGYHALALADPPVGAGFAIAGLLVPAVLGRSREERLGAWLAAVPATALGGLGFATFVWLNGAIAGV